MLDRTRDAPRALIDREQRDVDFFARRVLLGRIEFTLGHHRQNARDDLDQEIVRGDLDDLRDEFIAFEELSACSFQGSGSACLSESETFLASGSNFITSTETVSPIFTTSDGCLIRA